MVAGIASKNLFNGGWRMLKRIVLYFMVATLIVFCSSLAFAEISSKENALIYGYYNVRNSASLFSVAASPTTFRSNNTGWGIVGGGTFGNLFGTNADVYLNPGERGDALIYGYYNLRKNYANLFSVANTDEEYGARVRIRFLEAKDSTEMLDFDICLSPGDKWISYLIKDNDGVARLYSIDSDTYIDYGDNRGASSGIFGVKFKNGVQFRYGTSIKRDDGSVVSADDTLEGYFIVIAENKLSESGTGTKCGDLYDVNAEVDNVLYGNAYEINLVNGKTFGYNATALANFTDQPIITDPTAATPNLASGKCTNYQETEDCVNFVLTKRDIASNYYNIGEGTQLIVTFPTKKVSHTTTPTTDDIFDDPKVLVTIYDDKENSPTSTCEFSPCPPGTDVVLPNEVNVIRIDNSSIFDTKVGVSIDSPYDWGWIKIDFVSSVTENPVDPNHRVPFSGYINGYATWGYPAVAYVVTDIGEGINWMLPMTYSTTVEQE